MSDKSPDQGDEEVREVFAYYGRAIYGASCVETGLVLALMQVELMSQTGGKARRERKFPSKAEWESRFDAYMARHHGLTLGTLLERFRSVWRVEAALNELLGQALTCRNFLTHAFFRERAVTFAHSRGRRSMIDELEAAHGLFVRTDHAVQATAASALPKIGIDPNVLEAQVDAIARRELAEAIRKAQQKC